MSDTFLRYLVILQEMPHSPRRTDSATFALRLEERGLGVTRRTLQRDLEKLSRVLPIECADGTKPYGWSWKPGAGSPLPALAASLEQARENHGATPMETALATLDRWLSFRDGRFEAGLSPFIAAHLPDAIAAHTGLLLEESVVPLPLLQLSAVGPRFESSFALLSVDRHTVVLARLSAQPRPVAEVEGEPEPELEALAMSAFGRPEARLRVVFVEPHSTPKRDSLGFDDLAHTIARRGDPESRCLARYLRRWETLAGAPADSQAKGAEVISLMGRGRRG